MAPRAKPTRAEAARKRLAKIPGIGAVLAARLVGRGITTRARLRDIIGELPPETQAHLRYSIARQIPAARAAAVAREIARRLVFWRGGAFVRYPVTPVGSVRRKALISKDLDLLVVVPDGEVLRGLLAGGELRPPGPKDKAAVVESYASGDRRRSFVVRWAGAPLRYYSVDLFLATAEERPFALFHFTGGRDYNIRVRAHAKRQGFVLNQYGVFVERGAGGRARARNSKAIRTERDLLRFLGVTYRPPTERSAA